MSDVWPVVADVLVPSAAVLVSAGVAIGLARAERKAAAIDRKTEREHAEKARQRRKVEDALEPLLGTLAWFVTADPAREDWATTTRALRGQVYLVQALPDLQSRGLGEWLALEIERGLHTANDCFDQIEPNAAWSASSEQAAMLRAEVMVPFRLWVKCTMDLLVIWLRGDADTAQVKAWADDAAGVGWVLPDAGGGAQG
ncbi:hypothetical protein [Leucobacter sp.]